MEIKASAKYLRISPRKLRLLASGLVGLSTLKALENLKLSPYRGREFLKKLIEQAIANAENNLKLDKETMIIRKIEIGEGPSFRKIDKSHGARFDRGIIKKKTSHIFLTLESREENKITKGVEGRSTRPPSPRLRRVNGTKS